MFKDLAPQKFESIKLPKLNNTEVSELYKQLYKLEILKVELIEDIEIKSKASFPILESIISELSKNTSSNENGVIKSNSLAQLQEYKQQHPITINSKVDEINTEINNIYSRLKEHAISKLYNTKFCLDLTLTISADKDKGKLSLSKIEPDLRISIYYLFHKDVPQYDMSDNDLIWTMFECLPQDAKTYLENISIRPKKMEKEDLYINYGRYFANVIRKYFRGGITNHFAIPLGITQEEKREDITDNSIDLITTEEDIVYQKKFFIALNEDINPIYVKEEGFRKDSPLNEKSYDPKEDTCRLHEIEDHYSYDYKNLTCLIPIAGKIISQFIKDNLANNIKYHEKIQPR